MQRRVLRKAVFTSHWSQGGRLQRRIRLEAGDGLGIAGYHESNGRDVVCGKACRVWYVMSMRLG